MFLNWAKYGIDVPTNRFSGQYKAVCPFCRDSRGNPLDRSLSCNLATGEYNCHHCHTTGCVAEEEEWEKQQRKQAWFNAHPIKRQKKEYKKPTPKETAPMESRAIKWFEGRGISKDTLEALKVTEGMEYMPQKQRECNTVQFNYYKDGELINTKFRTGDKKFKMVSGAELIPYNIDNIKGQKECIITEGEMDALSFYEVGFHNVVSVPAGANANLEWLDDYMEDYFDPMDTIYVASDNDTQGEVLKNELLRRFGVERCKVVEYGDGCKDANDHLQKYGAESLRECITNAKEIRIDGVFVISDFEGALDAVYQHGWQKGVTIGHEAFDRLMSFETKRLCVVTGVPGSGKSEFIDEIAERLNIRYGWRWAYFSPENAPLAYHAGKLIEKFVGKRFGKDTMPYNEYKMAKEHLEDDFSFISPTDNFRLDNILEKARFLVRRRGIKALVIDPYNRLENEMGMRSETQYISQLLDKLTNFAQLHDVLVVLMAHPTKLQKNKDTGEIGMPTLYDIAGSANFYNKCDFGIIVHRDRAENVTIVQSAKVKFRHLGTTGQALFKFNINNGRYTDYENGIEPVYDNSNHLINSIKEKEQAAADSSVLPLDRDDRDENPYDNFFDNSMNDEDDEVPF